MFRVQQQHLIHGHWNTRARRVGPVLRALRRSNCLGWLKSWMFQHDLHLVRNLIALILLAACKTAVHLVHPDADLFHSQEIALFRMLSGTAALPAALEKLPRRSLC